MWLTNGVHVVDRLTLAHGLPGLIRIRQHRHNAPTTRPPTIPPPPSSATRTAWPASLSRSPFADGPPTMDTQVICANGTVRIIGGRQPVLQVGQGNEWQDIPFENPPAVMHYEWKSFVQSIEQDIEPPTSGEWSRHIMEILFAAETSAISGSDVRPRKRPLMDAPAIRHARHPQSRLDLRRTAAWAASILRYGMANETCNPSREPNTPSRYINRSYQLRQPTGAK